MSVTFPSIHDINVSAALRNYHLNPRLGEFATFLRHRRANGRC